MPRKNKRLEEALARVDAAIAKAQSEHDEAQQRYRQTMSQLAAVEQTRTFLTEGGKP